MHWTIKQIALQTHIADRNHSRYLINKKCCRYTLTKLSFHSYQAVGFIYMHVYTKATILCKLFV